MHFYIISMVLTMQTMIAEDHAMTIKRPYINITLFRQEKIYVSGALARFAPSPVLTQFIS